MLSAATYTGYTIPYQSVAIETENYHQSVRNTVIRWQRQKKVGKGDENCMTVFIFMHARLSGPRETPSVEVYLWPEVQEQKG